MKAKFFKRTVSLMLSGALMFTALPSLTAVNLSSDAAVNKARVSVHDPSIIKNDDTYYVFGSHIDAARTKDLQNWTRFTNGYARTNNVEFGNLSQNLKKAFASV